MKSKGFCDIKNRGASAKKYTTAILDIWSKSIVQKKQKLDRLPCSDVK